VVFLIGTGASPPERETVETGFKKKVDARKQSCINPTWGEKRVPAGDTKLRGEEGIELENWNQGHTQTSRASARTLGKGRRNKKGKLPPENPHCQVKEKEPKYIKAKIGEPPATKVKGTTRQNSKKPTGTRILRWGEKTCKEKKERVGETVKGRLVLFAGGGNRRVTPNGGERGKNGARTTGQKRVYAQKKNDAQNTGVSVPLRPKKNEKEKTCTGKRGTRNAGRHQILKGLSKKTDPASDQENGLAKMSEKKKIGGGERQIPKEKAV